MDEIWKPVVGYEGLYEVSNIGNVRRIDGIFMPTHLIPQGYLKVSFKEMGKSYLCHCLVMAAFVGERLGRVINHIDSNKLNNSLENLEYISKRENRNHALLISKKNGLPRGVFHTNGKYCSRYGHKGKMIYIGCFDDIESASKAYIDKIKELGEEKYATNGNA